MRLRIFLKEGQMTRSRALLVTLALSALGLLQLTASHAQAFAETQNSFFPIDLFVFVPCAVEGDGEVVELTGQLHDLFHITSDGRGRFHLKFHDNPQGLTGVGLTTGEQYQGTGVTEGESSFKIGFQSTFINNL